MRLSECDARFRTIGENDRHSSKSLHRRLLPKGNPSLDNLAAMLDWCPFSRLNTITKRALSPGS